MPFYLRCVCSDTFLTPSNLLTGAFDYCGSHCVWHLAVVAAVALMDQACQQPTLPDPNLTTLNLNPNSDPNPNPNPNPNPKLMDQASQQVASRPWDGSDCQVPGRRW